MPRFASKSLLALHNTTFILSMVLVRPSVCLKSIIRITAIASVQDCDIPNWKPFLNLLLTLDIDRIRPVPICTSQSSCPSQLEFPANVPVVFLLLAFSDQLYFLTFAAGYPQFEQVCFWICSDRLPHRRQRVCVLLWRLPKLDVPLVMLAVVLDTGS